MSHQAFGKLNLWFLPSRRAQRRPLLRKTGWIHVLRWRLFFEESKHGKRTQWSYPIGSMYAIYGNIYHQYTPNVSIYIPCVDPMGMATDESIVIEMSIKFILSSSEELKIIRLIKLDASPPTNSTMEHGQLVNWLFLMIDHLGIAIFHG